MLQEKLQNDLKESLKSGDAFRLSTLRMAQAALHNKALEKRAASVKAGGTPEDAVLNDEEALVVIRNEAKRRKDAAAEYEKGNRRDLAEKELKELEILKQYLPAEVDDAAIEVAVSEAVSEIGQDPKQFGRIMGLAMKKLGSGASGDRVSAAVKKYTSGQS